MGSHLSAISVASPFQNGNPQQTLAKVCTDIGLTTAHTFALHENSHGQGNSSSKGKKKATLSLPSEHQKNEKVGKKGKSGNGKQFSLSGLLSSYDQYAMSSGNGLLVKHNRYRQAGLNERNLICLF